MGNCCNNKKKKQDRQESPPTCSIPAPEQKTDSEKTEKSISQPDSTTGAIENKPMSGDSTSSSQTQTSCECNKSEHCQRCSVKKEAPEEPYAEQAKERATLPIGATLSTSEPTGESHLASAPVKEPNCETVQPAPQVEQSGKADQPVQLGTLPKAISKKPNSACGQKAFASANVFLNALPHTSGGTTTWPAFKQLPSLPLGKTAASGHVQPKKTILPFGGAQKSGRTTTILPAPPKNAPRFLPVNQLHKSTNNKPSDSK